MSNGLPHTMVAVEIAEWGGPEVLQSVTRPCPRPGHGEVLIRVGAAGVNRADIFQRLGKYPPPPGVSDIPGLEVAGEIAAVGSGVADWKPGDRVCALVAGGGYASYCTAPTGQCLTVPEGFDDVRAAVLPESCFTVWSNVFRRAHLGAGEVFLVHGGAGGIGTTAIQLASLRGARVFATAAGSKKCRACVDLGAERAIDREADDFVAIVKESSSGADVILDIVGGDYVGRNIDALAEDGRLICISFLKGSEVVLDLMKVMLKRLTITGATLRRRSLGFKATIAREVEAEIWPLLAQGRMTSVIDSTYPLAEAAQAHVRIETGAHIGKIALTV